MDEAVVGSSGYERIGKVGIDVIGSLVELADNAKDFWLRFHPGVYAAFSTININEALQHAGSGEFDQAIWKGVFGAVLGIVAIRQGNIVREVLYVGGEEQYKLGVIEGQTGQPPDSMDRARIERQTDTAINAKEKEWAKKPLWKRILKV